MLLHLFLHIHPRVIYSFAPYIRLIIEYSVKYSHTEIGHSYLVGIGKAECKSNIHLVFILYYLVIFTARISSGLFDLGYKAFDIFSHFIQ